MKKFRLFVSQFLFAGTTKRNGRATATFGLLPSHLDGVGADEAPVEGDVARPERHGAVLGRGGQ